MLTREEILKSRSVVKEKLAVPEWGGEVFVWVMPGMVRDAFEKAMVESRAEGLRNYRALLVVFCIVDENDNLLFTEADAAELGKHQWTILDRICDVAQRLNKINDKQLEEVKGNSEPTPGAVG